MVVQHSGPLHNIPPALYSSFPNSLTKYRGTYVQIVNAVFIHFETGLDSGPFKGCTRDIKEHHKSKCLNHIDLRHFDKVYLLFSLSDQDSNLDRQNQNLQCYRYTIGQGEIEVQIYIKLRFCQLGISLLHPGGPVRHWSLRRVYPL